MTVHDRSPSDRASNRAIFPHPSAANLRPKLARTGSSPRNLPRDPSQKLRLRCFDRRCGPNTRPNEGTSRQDWFEGSASKHPFSLFLPSGWVFVSKALGNWND